MPLPRGQLPGPGDDLKSPKGRLPARGFRLDSRDQPEGENRHTTQETVAPGEGIGEGDRRTR